MANISKLAKYQSSAVCLAGVSAAVWIIVYGKISHSRRRLDFLLFYNQYGVRFIVQLIGLGCDYCSAFKCMP